MLITVVYSNPKIVSQAVEEFGSQCIVAGVDYKIQNNARKPSIEKGSVDLDIPIDDYIKSIIDLGVGELFFNSIDHDGMMNGCDLDFIEHLSSKLNLPFIYSGGVGNFLHLEQALKFSDAVSCGSLFLLSDNSPMRARSYLRNQNYPIRKLK